MTDSGEPSPRLPGWEEGGHPAAPTPATPPPPVPPPARGDGALLPRARLSGPMPWVIAIMVAMTLIAAAAGLALRNVAVHARAEMSGGITIQIVEAGPEARARQANAALTALRAFPGVMSARQVPQDEIDRLISPWLGEDGDEAGSIPVPALLDARLDGPPDAARVRDIAARLRPLAPAARVDAQTGWLKPVFEAITTLQFVALALIVLLGAAMSAAVLLAVRTALGNHRPTIEIVHMLGGTDIQIARIFQGAIGRDAVLGGVAGSALAVILIVVLGSRFAALSAGLVEGGALGVADWAMLALVPFAAVALAMVTARLTVLGALRRIL